MPVVNSTPEQLKPYVFHGVRLNWSSGGAEAVGDCPWCDHEGKFYVAVGTGLWQCKVCGTGNQRGGGNALTFVRLLWEKAFSKTSVEQYKALAANRRLLHADTLISWGVCQSPLTGDWLVPGYAPDGSLCNLYRYAKVGIGDGDRGPRRVLMATSGLKHGLFGVPLLARDRPNIYFCEGPWDGMIWWETLRSLKLLDGYLVPTGNEAASLLGDGGVLAVPGCNVFPEQWCWLTGGKVVSLLFDSDHPKTNPKTGVTTRAGYDGLRRAVGVMAAAAAADAPAEVRYLNWGPDGYAPDLRDGTDVRDVIGAGVQLQDRAILVRQVLDKFSPIPAVWVPGRRETAADGQLGLHLVPCSDWKSLLNEFRKTMKVTEGLDRGLSVMLAVALSTKAQGDQLWMKIIGPPSSGKSVLCEAMSVNRRYVHSVSTLTGFHSGFKTDRNGKEDNSLIPHLQDKTLVIKDGDTLLRQPNLPQILAEARDLYDTTARTFYRHGLSRNYSGVRFSWILAGTENLREMDDSELGARFLDCVVVDEVDEDLERDIGLRKVRQALREMDTITDGKPETFEASEAVRFKQACGGYISYLRENAQSLLRSVEVDGTTEEMIQSLGEFTSFARARPSKKQAEKAQRELSYRLCIQLARLAKCLAVVLNRPTVDAEVMRRVTRTALDTARGRTWNILRELARVSPDGAEAQSLAYWVKEPKEKVDDYLSFLGKLKVVEQKQVMLGPGVKGRPRWYMTPRLFRLYNLVVEG